MQSGNCLSSFCAAFPCLLEGGFWWGRAMKASQRGKSRSSGLWIQKSNRRRSASCIIVADVDDITEIDRRLR